MANDPLATVDAVEVTCFSTPTSNQLDTKLNYDSAAVLPFLLLTARDFYCLTSVTSLDTSFFVILW